jgi:hypothetical protein
MRSVASAVLALAATGMLAGCGTVPEVPADPGAIDEVSKRGNDDATLAGEWHRIAPSTSPTILDHEIRTFELIAGEWVGTFENLTQSPGDLGGFNGYEVEDPDCHPLPDCPKRTVYAAEGTGFWGGGAWPYPNLFVLTEHRRRGEVLWWIPKWVYDYGEEGTALENVSCPWYRTEAQAEAMAPGVMEVLPGTGFTLPADCSLCVDGLEEPNPETGEWVLVYPSDGEPDFCIFGNGEDGGVRVELNCDNGLDEDWDGATDGADTDCQDDDDQGEDED